MTFKSTGEAYNEETWRKDGAGQVVGFFGEKGFAEWLMENSIPFCWVGSQAKQYDFLLKRLGKKITLDVKAKERHYANKDYFDAHVYLHQKDYDCDVYVFASLLGFKMKQNNEYDPPEKIELCGWITKESFWQQARIVRKGEKDGNYIEQKDAGKVKHANLHSMDTLIDYLEGKS